MQEGGPLESRSMTESCMPQTSSSAHADSPSSGNCKKRERTDDADKGNGENSAEEYGSPQKRECLKVAHIASVTDEDGRLPDTVAVDQLICKMQEAESCSQRGMLSDTLATTLKEDSLRHFVSMGGVTVLDDWLQDGYKAARSADAEAAVDKLVTMILQVLEKLPINLETLKDCSIGKSVNHLRSHKNVEIQKKAKNLVDVWKKRVDFELKHNNLSIVESDNVSKDDLITCSAKTSDISDADESSRHAYLQEVSLTPVVESASSTKVASPNLSNVTHHRKLGTMDEKDTINNNDQYCPSSTTSLLVQSPNDVDNEDNYTAAGNPSSCNEEVSNQGDLQQSERKHSRSGNNCKNDNPNGLTSSSIPADTQERTNEYRKKLRSSGSKTLPCTSVSHPNATQANVSCPTHESARVIDLKENKISGDDGVGSQKQLSLFTKDHTYGKFHKVESSEMIQNMAHDFPDTRCSNKEVNSSLEGEKVDSLKTLSASMISSCTEKQKMAGSNLNSLSEDDGGKFTDADTLKQQQQDVSLDSMQNFAFSNSRMEMKDDPSGTAENSECKLNGDFALKRTFSSLRERGGASLESARDGTSHIDMTRFGAQSTNASDTGDLGKDVSFPSSGKNINEADRTKETVSSSNKSSQPTPTNGNTGTINLEGAVSHLCLNFDLNEGFAEDESSKEDIMGSTTIESMLSSKLSTPVAVIAATKGAFVPPANTLTKCDAGWKGSAATSAFRPAPLKSVSSIERQTSVNQVKNVNNFDLNVPDQDIKEDGENNASRYRQHRGLDLNFGGEDMETDIQTSVPENPRRLLPKPPVLDFDLNEGPKLEEMHQEQSSISGWYNNTSLVGTNMPSISRGIPIWNTSGTTFPAVTINMPGRSEPASMGPMAPQIVGPPRSSATIVHPPQPSEVYSQPIPYFRGMPFISTSSTAHNPIQSISESAFVVPKVPTQGSLSRSSASRSSTFDSRPLYMIDLEADGRGSNGFYTWGRQDQNTYDSTGPTIINYKDIGVNIKDHQDAGVMSMEDQMHLYHQAAVPVTSLKRKDSDYAAFTQSTWR